MNTCLELAIGRAEKVNFENSAALMIQDISLVHLKP
jgi:hypothetical protein